MKGKEGKKKAEKRTHGDSELVAGGTASTCEKEREKRKLYILTSFGHVLIYSLGNEKSVEKGIKEGTVKRKGKTRRG